MELTRLRAGREDRCRVSPDRARAGTRRRSAGSGTPSRRAGYDYLLAYDHVVGAVHDDRHPPLWGPYTERDPFHDPFVMFAYLAAMTERIEFATGVLILPQRQTVLVAKQAADLDLLSGGRFRLGVGVGWNYVEYDALGEDFARRASAPTSRSAISVSCGRVPWRASTGTFDRLDRGAIVPGPRPTDPDLGRRVLERSVRTRGALGDGFIFAGDEARVHGALGEVRALASDRGRALDGFGLDYVALTLTTPGAAADAAARWSDAGGTHFSAVSMGAGR